jgi:hypothetical protein
MELQHSNYTHEKYTEHNQYWCPESEPYAAASQLLSAIRCGWKLALSSVSGRQVWQSGIRPCTIYEFALQRGAQLMIMPVLSNPFVERFLVENQIRVHYDNTPDHIVLPE